MRQTKTINPLYFVKNKQSDVDKFLRGRLHKMTREQRQKRAERENEEQELEREEENEGEEEKSESEDEEEEEEREESELTEEMNSVDREAKEKIDKIFNIKRYNFFSYARHNKYNELETLFLQGLNPDSKDEHGNTVLIVAAQNNNKRIVKLALRYGAQINMQNSMGNTALHFAKEYKYKKIYDYLVQKGANPDIENVKKVKAKFGIKVKRQEKELFLGYGLERVDSKIKNKIV